TSDKAGSVKVEAEVGGVTSSTDLSFVADNATATIDENGLTAEAGNTVANGTYADFGPTLACEKLAEIHDLYLAKETEPYRFCGRELSPGTQAARSFFPMEA
ncbi:hypothetical protein, partial [Serratia fonticola]